MGEVEEEGGQRPHGVGEAQYVSSQDKFYLDRSLTMVLQKRRRARFYTKLVFHAVQRLHLDYYNRSTVCVRMVLSEVRSILSSAGLVRSSGMAAVIPFRSRWYVSLQARLTSLSVY